VANGVSADARNEPYLEFLAANPEARAHVTALLRTAAERVKDQPDLHGELTMMSRRFCDHGLTAPGSLCFYCGGAV
jgi:hypothetical protein